MPDASNPQLGAAQAARQIVAMCGVNDPRVEAWDKLVREVPA
ncbi:MAG: hypothetical protein WD768_22105 [Phycisphaeraceae bacterium]